jgi:hypothetical protein
MSGSFGMASISPHGECDAILGAILHRIVTSMRRFPAFFLALLAAASVLAACGSDPASGGSFEVAPSGSTPAAEVASSAPASTASPVPSPTEPALPHTTPPTSGKPFPHCSGGWVTPADGSPDATDPLGIIRRTTGEDAAFEVVDMRLFVGPESPPSVGEGAKGYLQNIRRWYVKLYAPDDLAFQGRFIVEQRVFGRGLAAVAPYDSRGFRSPDWFGFQWESASTDPASYPGLPGEWTGTAYDFVKGGEGLDLPGLPEAVAGCLDGT